MKNLTIIAFTAEGYEVRFQADADPSSAKLAEQIAWMQRNGFRPRRDLQWTPEGLPICPKHQTPMNKREKQGDVWYSHNMGTREEPTYCRGYPSATSPGWFLGEAAPVSRQEPEDGEPEEEAPKPAQRPKVQPKSKETARDRQIDKSYEGAAPKPAPAVQQPAASAASAARSKNGQKGQATIAELNDDLFAG